MKMFIICVSLAGGLIGGVATVTGVAGNQTKVQEKRVMENNHHEDMEEDKRKRMMLSLKIHSKILEE